MRLPNLRRRASSDSARGTDATPDAAQPAPTGPQTTSSEPVARPGLPAHAPGTVAALAVLLGCGVATWGPVFGDLSGYRAAAGGVLIGGLCAVFAAWRRWTALTLAAVLVLGYLLTGGALALPTTTVAGVAPTLNTLQLLLVQAAHSWKDLLTIQPPAAAFTGPAVAPLLAGLVCSALAVSLGLRARRPWALLPPVALLITGIAWGLRDARAAAAGVGVVFALTALAWVAWRLRPAPVVAEDPQDADAVAPPPRGGLRRASTAAALLTVAAAAAVVLTVVVPVGPRQVLRDRIRPPLDLHQYASPLTSYRYLEKDKKDDVLFTVDGLPDGGRIHLATVDAYDGIVYNVGSGGSGGFAHVGDRIADLPDARPLTITVGDYSGVWLPGGGEVAAVSFDGADATAQAEGLYYNADTGTLLTTAKVAEGASYTVQVAPVVRPADARLTAFDTVPLPDPAQVPDSVTGQAGEYVGSANAPLEQVNALANRLRSDGFYSDGSQDGSRPGHSTNRIDALFTEPQMVGDDEQYAVAMALMARRLGMPARVVMGFYPDAYTDGPIEITGKDAHVWVEVAFQGAGWVAFDPTPDRNKTPDQNVPKPKQDPQPQVFQPPDPPREPPEQQLAPLDNQADGEEQPPPQWLITTLIVVGVTGSVVALLVGPPLLVIALKRRRRRRRRETGATVDRVAGGWDEIVDTATDLGVPVRPGGTRGEAAVELARSFPNAATIALAVRADTAVFGPGEPDQAGVDQVWAHVDVVHRAMVGSVPRRRRVLARITPRSLRASRRSAGASLPGFGPGRVRRFPVLPRQRRTVTGSNPGQE